MASYSDDFNRADSTNVGNWTELIGDWTIASNQLVPDPSGIPIIRYGSDLDTVDHYAEVEIAALGGNSIGVIARINVGSDAYYLWRNNGTTWDLFRAASGVFTPIAQYAAAAAPGDVARLQCKGNFVKGFVNGIERVSIDDGVPANDRFGVGIRCTGSSTLRYDNFAAADIGSDTGAFFDFLEA